MLTDEMLIDIFKKNSSNIADKDIVKVDNNILIKKVAFDIYKVDNDPYEGLWAAKEIEGENFLVRLSNPTYNKKADGDWSAVSDYGCENITLSYKNAPVARFSSAEYEFDKESVFTFKSALLERMNNDNDFVSDLIRQQPEAKVAALCNTFPELSTFFNKE